MVLTLIGGAMVCYSAVRILQMSIEDKTETPPAETVIENDLGTVRWFTLPPRQPKQPEPISWLNSFPKEGSRR